MATNSTASSITSSPSSTVGYHQVKTPRKRNSSGNSGGNNNKSATFNCEKYHYTHHYSLNSLWSIWYGIIAVAFQIYIIARSVKRFTLYVSLPWPDDQPPYKELNTYVILTGLGVVILPFFVVTSMMKIGNNANDGQKLGSSSNSDRRANGDHEAVYENVRNSSQNLRKKKRFRALKSIWKHSVPTVALLHTLASLCFLVSRLLMEAQIIKYGFLPKGDIWCTEMDFILNHLEDRKVSMLGFLDPINETDKHFLGKYKDSDERSLLNEALLMKPDQMKMKLDLEPGRLSAEFINFAIALFVHAIRYPSVFWNISKSFGLVFSIILVVNTFQSLMSYAAFTVLYKIQVFNPEKILLRYPNKLSLDSLQTLILFLSYLVLLMTTSTVFYYYGLNKHEECRKRNFIKLHITSKRNAPLLWGYCPHFFAFISLMLLAFCGIPLMYDFIVIYCGTLDATSLGEPPLLVIDNGKTFQIREHTSKRAVVHLVSKLLAAQKASSPLDNEDIYWLKPRPPSPKEEPKNSTENCTLSWLRNKRKTDSSKKQNQGSEKASSSCNKANKKKSNKSKKSNGIEVDDCNSDDGDYATLRQIVQRDETDENLANTTHLSLCPLKDENFAVRQPLLSPKANGDYELLVETNTVPNNTNAQTHNHPHHQAENLTPCSGSLSESSNSPEKSSDTSSGVHSTSSAIAEKRSNSVENLLQYMNARPTWKSLSLQRYINNVSYEKPQRVACIPTFDETSMRGNTMTIKRVRPQTEVELNSNGNDLFGRSGVIKMTSFTDNSDLFKSQQTSAIPKLTDIVSDKELDLTTNALNLNEQLFKITENPLDELENKDKHSAAIAMMYSHQRRDSANFSLASSAGESDIAQKL
ncbi:uncharacterized protein B4U79_05489 [Dinothrombium tinctorium]|uniref:Protein tincar-like protein n=1 Tax=Dinothrombium tinctorium TaxID=1965070 RepID=A0A3S3PH29_9ACAR|nr:uncharacterized protein B4U79_05489 [Dinothrombium tinctorium]